MPLAPGATFERYAIEALVGRGGMGEVYKAVDTRLHRAVALKVLRSDKDPNDATTSGGVQRLLREARAAAAFNHANSVAIYELGEAEGIPYIAMEYVVGSSLRAYVGDRTVSLEVKVGWLVDVARALWAAHKAGLVHRDVKPGNIMVSDEGAVKVLDFGLAKPTKKVDPAAFQTLMGQVLGTPRYMSPEQLEGVPADARSDQFAFGVVAYELLSGAYPGGPLAGAPQPIHEVDPRVPRVLSRAVLRMMSREPEARFATMEEASAALRECVPSVRNLKVPPSGGHAKRRKTTSDAPTMEQQIDRPALENSGEVSIDMPLSQKTNTQPLPAAVGAEVSRRVAAAAAAATSPNLTARPSPKTMPLALQAPSIPPTPAAPSTPRSRLSAHSTGHPSPMSVPSGVVSVQGHAPPRPSPSQPSVTTPANPIAPIISAPITAPRAQQKSNIWIAVVIVVFLLMIGGGAVVALTLR